MNQNIAKQSTRTEGVCRKKPLHLNAEGTTKLYGLHGDFGVKQDGLPIGMTA